MNANARRYDETQPADFFICVDPRPSAVLPTCGACKSVIGSDSTSAIGNEDLQEWEKAGDLYTRIEQFDEAAEQWQRNSGARP